MGDAARSEPLDHRRRGRRRREPFGLHRHAQLAEQERVALRRSMTRGVELVVAGAEAPADQSGRAVRGERARAEPQRRVLLDVTQKLGLGARLGRPARQHDGHSQALQAGREMRDEAQRRLVGSVGVVDRQQDRPLLAQLRAEPVEAVQRREHPILRRLGRTRHGRLGAKEERLGQAGGAAKQPSALERLEAVRAVLEQLPHHAVRVVALELHAGRAEDVEAALLRQTLDLAQQAGLADSGMTLDHENPARARRCGVQLGRRLSELLLTLVEPDLAPRRPSDAGGPSRARLGLGRRVRLRGCGHGRAAELARRGEAGVRILRHGALNERRQTLGTRPARAPTPPGADPTSAPRASPARFRAGTAPRRSGTGRARSRANRRPLARPPRRHGAARGPRSRACRPTRPMRVRPVAVASRLVRPKSVR